MAFLEIENCPKCKRQLTGAIETSASVVGGIQFVVTEETPDRNWIICDSCNQTVCKSCCVMPTTSGKDLQATKRIQKPTSILPKRGCIRTSTGDLRQLTR